MFFKKMKLDMVFKIHIGWKIVGLLIWFLAFPNDFSSIFGQGLGIAIAVFVFVNLQNEKFYVKWIWYIYTAFTAGTFYIYLISEKVPYFYIITLPVVMTQLLSVFKIYQDEKYL